jgi:hypothetical protein
VHWRCRTRHVAGRRQNQFAVQDAVTANILADALRERRAGDELLQSVQRRREFPTRRPRRLANAHKVFAQLFRNIGPVKAPWQLKAAGEFGITHVIGRAVGIDSPEHIQDARRSRLNARSAWRRLHFDRALQRICTAYGKLWGAR